MTLRVAHSSVLRGPPGLRFGAFHASHGVPRAPFLGFPMAPFWGPFGAQCLGFPQDSVLVSLRGFGHGWQNKLPLMGIVGVCRTRRAEQMLIHRELWGFQVSRSSLVE